MLRDANMLMAQKLIQIWNLFLQYLASNWISFFRVRKANAENLFVDISTYEPTFQTLVKNKNLFFQILCWFLGSILAYLLNDSLVYLEEPSQTVGAIYHSMGLGFAFVGILTILILCSLQGIQQSWKFLESFEESIQGAGFFFILTGVLFVLLCILKYYILLFMPLSFQYFIKIGDITIYIIQALFFAGFTICFYRLFIRFYRLYFIWEEVKDPNTSR
jgi:hypothetical protein